MTQYVVLAANSNQQVQAFGTPTGRVFLSEQQANQAKRTLLKRYPNLDWMVLPLTGWEPGSRSVSLIAEPLRDLVGYERQLHKMRRVDLLREAGRWGVRLTQPTTPGPLPNDQIIQLILEARKLEADPFPAG